MKITESRLRRLIRQVIRESVTDDTPAPGDMIRAAARAAEERDDFGIIDEPDQEQEGDWDDVLRARVEDERIERERVERERIERERAEAGEEEMDHHGFVDGLDLFNDL
jgi:hypothetical protein